jgi:hypothetical protein
MDRISFTLISCLATAPALAAQKAPNACGLLTKAEVDQLINRGRNVPGAPTAISISGGKGSVCDYPAGAQVGLYVGPNSQANFEWALKAYQITEKDKKPVSGIGDKAYLFHVTSKNPVDHGTTLVMTVGEYTVTAQIAAHVSDVDVNPVKGIYCRSSEVSAGDKAECAKVLADKTEPPETVAPAVQELGKVVAAKVKAGKF